MLLPLYILLVYGVHRSLPLSTELNRENLMRREFEARFL